MRAAAIGLAFAGLPVVLHSAATEPVAIGVPASQPSVVERQAEHLAFLKGAIRLHAAADFARHCLLIDLPDSAFIPIELNGDGFAELAVAFGRVACAEMGATGFSSTGGSLVQFWSARKDERPRMLVEAHMIGFTAGNLRLVTQQHGAECGLPGAAGCLVTYRWRDPDLSEMITERRPGGLDQPMQYNGLEKAAGIPVNGPRNRSEQLARMRAAIRQDARLNYGERCGPIEIPDNAFNEVEVTGDDFPELAVSLARARCWAGGANAFEGTGGPLMQFWHMNRDYEGRDGPIRLLLETAMRGFTPTGDKMIAIEHGARCPGVAGFCRVTYAWDARSQHLDMVDRRPSNAGPQSMRFQDRELGWIAPNP